MNFGETLSMHRKAANLTLRDFADKVSYDSSNISKVERGRINPPIGSVILRRWGAALGLEADSKELANFVAKGIAARVAKTTLSDEEVEELMPAFFRTVDNRTIDPDTYEKLRSILRTNL